uniref:Cytochrome P450 CYP3-like member 3 n=1 Tax=Phallusia mammillata TaxID=59560 RepID=A0A6F9D9V7_9ASCI|nr:cytochrome P450 CYP3-like member 3 [Phallusia mammillata]
MSLLSCMFSWETLLLCITVVLLIRYYMNQKWQVLCKLGIPHDPPSIRGLGNLGTILKDPDNIFKMDAINKKKFGYIYGNYNGLIPQITVGDPKILKHIFIKDFETFPIRQKIFTKVNGPELNSGVNLVGGQEWRRIRNTLSPTFSAAKLKQMMGIIDNCVEHTVEKLRKHVKEDDGEFQTKDIFGSLSLDVICASAFSTNLYGKDNTESIETKKMAMKFFDFTISGSPIFLLFYMFPWTETIAAKLGVTLFNKECVRYFSSLVDMVIKRRETSNLKSRTDLLQLMLEAEVPESKITQDSAKGMSRQEIVGNSLIMMLAGFETTGNAMMFLAFNLARHMDVQEKLYEEIQQALEEYGSFTYEAVNGMKYLNQCINESLRLYGPLPRNSRYAEKDFNVDGVHIPKGVMVKVPVYGMSYDEEYWDEPKLFKPERMEDMSKIDPMVFQPFGAGPRNCVGMRLALLEIRVAMCKLLNEFSFEVASDTPSAPMEVTFKGAMRPKKNFHLKAVPRN